MIFELKPLPERKISTCILRAVTDEERGMGLYIGGDG